MILKEKKKNYRSSNPKAVIYLDETYIHHIHVANVGKEAKFKECWNQCPNINVILLSTHEVTLALSKMHCRCSH